MPLLPRDGESSKRLIGRWAGAATCVALMHAGVAYAVVNWPAPKIAAGDPPAAIMIELAPLPVAPEVPQQNLAVGPQTVMSETSDPSESRDEPVKPEPVKPVAEPTPEPPKPPAELKTKTEAEIPKLPEFSTAEAVLEQKTTTVEPEKKPEPEKAPTTPPEPEKKVEKTPPKEEKKKEQEKKKPQEAKKAAQATTAPKPTELPRAKTNAAPTSGVLSSVSVSSWRGSVIAHLNRLKRYPGGGGGTSSVAFTIDRSGRVLSARLIRSSGSAILDQEAVALARRASPVPPPPPNIGGGAITLTVPVRFSG